MLKGREDAQKMIANAVESLLAACYLQQDFSDKDHCSKAFSSALIQ